jgi:hypothetical protein
MACCPNCGMAEKTRPIRDISHAERRKLPKVFSRKEQPLVELHIKNPFQFLFYSEEANSWVQKPCLVRKPLSANDIELRIVVCYVAQHIPIDWLGKGVHSESIRLRNSDVTEAIRGVMEACALMMSVEQQIKFPRDFNCRTLEKMAMCGWDMNRYELLSFFNFSIASFELVFNSKACGVVGHIDVQNLVK